MPRGAYTAKQERKADHIEKSYEKRGVSKKEAEERAWRIALPRGPTRPKCISREW